MTIPVLLIKHTPGMRLVEGIKAGLEKRITFKSVSKISAHGARM